MNRTIFSCICLSLWTIMSCNEEFDEHYKTSGKSTIKENIVDVLRANPDFSLFVEAIDRLDLSNTLGKSAIYTCLAQTNKDVESYLKSKGYASIQDVPTDELTVWLNFHLIMGMYYRYDIELRTSTYSDPDDLSFYRSNTNWKTREDSKHPGKFLRLYTTPWLTERGGDYQYLHNIAVDPDVFMAEDVAFSDQYDIDASNGVIHVLSAPLEPLPRADEAIARDTSLSIVNSWLDRFVQYNIKGPQEDGKIDTTKIKSYGSIGANLANEASKLTFIAPTNESIRKFFSPYLADNFYNCYDSIPNSLVAPILQTALVSDYFGMSDITRGNRVPFIRSVASTYIRKGNDVEPYYAGGVPSSNAMIYKIDKMMTPPLLNSVEGGIHVNKSKYSQWGVMVNNAYINGLTDPLMYEHPLRTILIQPDDLWEVYVSDMKSEERDSMSRVLYTSIILDNIQDGEFENNKYYNTSCGSLLYKDKSFIDYRNTVVKLRSGKAVWSGSNGAIYDVDGFFHPLSAADTMQNLYKMYLEETEEYTLFKIACDLSGVSEKLKLAGSFQYTILAPTDEAMIEAGMEDMNYSEEEMREFVQRHVIQRKIFTDGKFSGVINNMNGELISLSGAWDSFTITDESGQSIPFILEKSNRQANNGVLHHVTKVLKKKQ